MTKRRKKYLTVGDVLAAEHPDERIREAEYTTLQPTPYVRWVPEGEFQHIER